MIETGDVEPIEETQTNVPLWWALEGPSGSGKTERLIEWAAGHIQEAPHQQGLVLCLNQRRKQRFEAELLARLNRPLGQSPVYTFAGWVRNLTFQFWPLAEARIHQVVETSLSPVVQPVLSGMEDSELILNTLLALERQAYPGAFDEFPGTERGLLKQLARRLRLRSENGLSRQDMVERSRFLGEVCVVETGRMEQMFDKASYALRVLDSNKQLDIFMALVREEPAVQQWMKETIGWLVVDDVDETTHLQQQYMEQLVPWVKAMAVAGDPEGGTRRGYLNAFPQGWPAIKERMAEKQGAVEILSRQDGFVKDAQGLLQNWQQDPPRHIFSPKRFHVAPLAMTRVEMMDQLIEDVVGLLSQGASPGDVVVVVPQANVLSIYPIQSRFLSRGIPVQLLSGTRRPVENPICWALLNLIQWVHAPQWRRWPSPLEMRSILEYLLRLSDLNPNAMQHWVERYEARLGEGEIEGAEYPALASPAGSPDDSCLAPEDWPDLQWLLADSAQLDANPTFNERLYHLAQWIAQARTQTFHQQLYSAFLELASPYLNHEPQLMDWRRIVESYHRQGEVFTKLMAGGWMDGAEVLESHEEGWTSAKSIDPRFDRLWCRQVKAGLVADTPESPEAIDETALIIGTPQKVLDGEIRRPYQCWMDLGSPQWSRTDNAPLYDAWVHSAAWDGSDDCLHEGFQDGVLRNRAGHIMRGLVLLAGKEIRCYDSELDDEGSLQQGLLRSRMKVAQGASTGAPVSLKRAVLRPDQAPILDYCQGTMAITAVPGSGKTFVNIELILELISRGVGANSILVLTYMESAAKTILQRLRDKLGQSGSASSELPTVCTIHSLAFRVLMENDHAVKLGLRPHDGETAMAVVDDFQRMEILQHVATQTRPEQGFQGDAEAWARAIGRGIGHAKNLGLTVEHIETALRSGTVPTRITEILPSYKMYQDILTRRGFLDYSDLILNAVILLEQEPEVRQRYTTQFRYIMEDEAQDSSYLLQRFIQLMGGDAPNLVRTGDTNQSITTTFSSADTRVFRDFLHEANTVVTMDYSARCAPGVMRLANYWLRSASTLPGLEEAFIPVDMKPVPQGNPSLWMVPRCDAYPTEREENHALVEQIRRVQEQWPEATMAVLVRRNQQVLQVTQWLQQHQIQAISHSDSLHHHPVFQVILWYLELLVKPRDAKARLALYKAMHQAAMDQVDHHSRRQALWIEGALQAVDVFSDELENVWEAIEHQGLPELASQEEESCREFLAQLYYDWQDFHRDVATQNPVRLMIRMTEHLFTGVAQRSNGYLCAVLAQEALDSLQQTGLEQKMSPLEWVVWYFRQQGQGGRSRKCFTDEMVLGEGSLAGRFVQVMTLHKSKGQEFDVVFMPYLIANVLPHDPGTVRLDEGERMVLALDLLHQLRGQGKGTTPSPASAWQQANMMLKRAKVEEEARLAYVGITRAKRAIVFSTHRQGVNRFNRVMTQEPAKVYEVMDFALTEYGHLLEAELQESGEIQGVPGEQAMEVSP